jgi:hypothetical protein
MTVADTAPANAAQTDAPACADDAGDWARPLLERQLWILGQLAEGGLEIARAIERAATDEGSDDAVRAAAPMAYARVARAVRLTILLQSKLIADLQALEAKAAREVRSEKIDQKVDRPDLLRRQMARIHRIVRRVAWAQGKAIEEVERLARDAVDRLDQDELYGDLLSRPVSEIIAHICRDLRLEPDWPQLAEEAWAQDEIASGAAGAPLAALMAEEADARRLTAVTKPIRFAARAASP